MSNYNKEPRTLQEAYLSVIKKTLPAPTNVQRAPVSTSPVREIAPGLKTQTHSPYEEESGCEMCGEQGCECSAEENDTTGQPVAMQVVHGHDEESDSHHMEGDVRFSTSDEDEEDDMTIDNIHSIKDSLMKISLAVASGVHMEPWQQTKLAIVMDNLASIARSVPRQSSCL